MDEGAFIHDEQVVNLDRPTSRCKRRRKYVESNVITENKSEIYGKNLEIITPGGDLDDDVVNTTQNAIHDRLQRDKLVHNGNTFNLNVWKLYRLTEVQEKYQIRKPHGLHVHT